MALEIPKDPKIYTTVYDGFKGVDYTNDATNVYRKRSPSARNMKPALDGKPYKREGWHIEKTPDDFAEAAGFIPAETIFSLDGYDVKSPYDNPMNLTVENSIGSLGEAICNVGGMASNGTYILHLFNLQNVSIGSGKKRIVIEAQDTGSSAFSSEPRISILLYNDSGTERTIDGFNSINKEIILEEDEHIGDITATFRQQHNGLYGYEYTLTIKSIEEYDISINRLYYFELNGIEHILAFTDKGLFIYNENNEYESNFALLTTNADCIDSYERAFFFEGDGKSAFYIYGNYKIWSYSYDNGFVFKEEVPYIPLIRIATTPDGSSGAVNENVNMFGSLVYEAYQNNLLTNTIEITSVGLDNLEVSNEFYKKIPNNGTYVFTFSGGIWTYGGSEVNIYDYGINFTGEPADGYTITVRTNSTFAIKVNKVINTVNLDDIEVMVSTSDKFDTKLTVKNSGTPSSGEVLVTDGEEDTTFTFARAYMPLVDGEDAIRVMYKRETVSVEVVTTTSQTVTVTSRFIGG